MSAADIVTISAAVVALTQLAKWGIRRDGLGPVIVVILSLLGVALWAVSRDHLTRADIWAYFAGWVAVATSASGVYGFTKTIIPGRVGQPVRPETDEPPGLS